MFQFKKFISLFTLSLLFWGASWAGVVFYQLNVPTESSRWAYECINQKKAYANSIQGKKILIVSGSNGLFGINSKKIEDEMHIPSVNMAVYAALGIEYILEQAKEVARPGDTIILPLEYEQYNNSGNPDTVLIDYLCARDPGYIREKNLVDSAKIIYGIDTVRLIQGIKNKIKPEPQKMVGYQAFTLNKNGDETNNAKTDSKTEVLLKLAPSKILVHGIKEDSKSWYYLTKFILWCESNKIQLLVTYPSILDNESYHAESSKKTVKQIEDFWKMKGVTILGSYEEFMYGPEYFYDTVYHLNNVGMDRRTDQLLHYIKTYVSS